MIKFLQTTRVDANIADSVSICFLLSEGGSVKSRRLEFIFGYLAMYKISFKL